MTSLASPDPPADLTTEDLASRFEAGTLPDGDFTHRDHVRVAWELLRWHPLGTALHQMIKGVRTLAQQRSLPKLYHDTITTFYLLAIADARAYSPSDLDFTRFAELHPSLLGNSRQYLLAFYTAETLDSPRARKSFLLPERLPTPKAPGL